MKKKISTFFIIIAALLVVGGGAYASDTFSYGTEIDVQTITEDEANAINYSYNADTETSNLSFLYAFTPESDGSYSVEISGIDSDSETYAHLSVLDENQASFLEAENISPDVDEDVDEDVNVDEDVDEDVTYESSASGEADLMGGNSYYICIDMDCYASEENFSGTVYLTVSKKGELDLQTVETDTAYETTCTSDSLNTVTFTPETTGDYKLDAVVTSDSAGFGYVYSVTCENEEVSLTDGICHLEQGLEYRISYGAGETEGQEVSVAFTAEKIETESLSAGESISLSQGSTINYTADHTGNMVIYSTSGGDPYAKVYDNESFIIGENDDALGQFSDNEKDFAMIVSMESGKSYTIFAEDYNNDDFEVHVEKYLLDNTITASNITKTYSGKSQSFAIGAKCEGEAPLSYSSSNKYITVSKTGKITVKAKYIGSATITIKSAETGEYKAAAKKITVTVGPKGTTIRSLTRAKKAFTVKWKKQTTGTSGYQIRYSLYSSMKSAKTVTITKNKTTSKKISKLKSKKKYYVQIRTYKKVGGKKYYSAWSSKKSVVILKL